ncbi:2-hydroxychromene-2-carboxylate isomerase [Phenylobacterium sp.]|uniref:2-hydroxychromene-2-carboxylate isomerase n=1 Tax=Phenylobacterium sp. TaxID=1871053 RepID=UPI002FD9E17A
MARTLDFIFDFGSPNAYLAWKALPPILERTGASVAVRPVLLGGLFKLTGNRSPMEAFGEVQGKLAYEALETRRFVARHGLDAYRMNPHFPVNTLLIMRGLVAAQAQGLGGPYLEAVLAAMWEQGLKMDDPAVVAGVLGAAGLDAQALLEATQDPGVKARLLEETQAAAARGAFGVPTFFVGEEMFFGKDRLGQVEEALATG